MWVVSFARRTCASLPGAALSPRSSPAQRHTPSETWKRSELPDAPGNFDCLNRGVHPVTDPISVVSKQKPFELSGGVELDLLGGSSDPSAATPERVGWDPGGMAAPVFYEITQETYIVYWFFYPYNDWDGGHAGNLVTERHEGDWEHIAVRLDEHSVATEGAYYQHYCPARDRRQNQPAPQLRWPSLLPCLDSKGRSCFVSRGCRC